MSSDKERIERLELHVEALAGTQTLLRVLTILLASEHYRKPQSLEAFHSAFERTRAELLASTATDFKISAFDTAAESFLSQVKGLAE